LQLSTRIFYPCWYRFGRTELLPVKTNSKGLARYVGKYIAKHIDSRLPEDKGYRPIRTTVRFLET